MTARHPGADTVEQQHAQHPQQKSLSECPICHSSDGWHWQIIGYYRKIGLWVEWCEKCGHIIPHTPSCLKVEKHPTMCGFGGQITSPPSAPGGGLTGQMEL